VTAANRTDMGPARLALGPILFHWEAAAKRDFYFRIADEAPIDIVYLGETACSKRAPFFEPHLPEIAERLARAGKEVVYSTLALVMSARETAALCTLAMEPGLVVELNDLAGADLVAGRRHVIGPFVNVYNEETLRYLARRGAERVVLPAELPKKALAALASDSSGAALEVQAFGRLPLALSSRCYHARAHGLHKDGCQYVCSLDADGLSVTTLDGDGFLAINGTMTMSFTVINLLAELAALRCLGVSVFRLWPQSADMVAISRLFRDTLDGHLDSATAEIHLAEKVRFAPLTRTFYQGPELG